MLEGRKVNGKYDLAKIENDTSLNGDYLSSHKTKFFKLFPKAINNINNLYKKYFPEN